MGRVEQIENDLVGVASRKKMAFGTPSEPFNNNKKTCKKRQKPKGFQYRTWTYAGIRP